MKKSEKPRLAMTGKGKGGRKGFEITTDPQPPEPQPTRPPDVLRPKEPPRVEPHLIHNGSGVPCCSVCASPVNFPEGSCGVCQCGAQFGGCG